MARTRDDFREEILDKLLLHGPLCFAQLMAYLQGPTAAQLDYDLRCLRKANQIRSIPGRLWEIVE
jgi:hypothetical protein